MFVYMSKKIAIPKQSIVSCISWNKSSGYIAVGGDDGMLKVLKLESGAVIVGSVDGSRVWGKDIKGPGLAGVQWSPDNSLLLFALSNGELQLYDNQGNFAMPVATHCIEDPVEIVALDWYSGKAPPTRPVLVVCYRNGIIQLMKNCIDEDMIIVEINMAAVDCCWNHNGTTIAVAGLNNENSNAVQFFNTYGEHLRTLRVPNGAMKAISWEGHSLRLAIAIDSFIYFANVKPDHRYAFYGNTLAFCSGTETVVFWDVCTHQTWVNHIPNVIQMCALDEYCVIATSNALIISNQQGIQCDAKSLTMTVISLSMNSKATVVAASRECFLIWKFATSSRPNSPELMFFADGTPYSSGDGTIIDDFICCITCSDSHLLIGKQTGNISLFSMLNYKKITSINLSSKPYKLGLNSNSSKFYVIDQGGSLFLLDTEMANNISVGQPVRKDVWCALWATDNPTLIAVAEKARLYVLRGPEPEEPLTMQGYLCQFKDLEITSVLLDDIIDKCTEQHIIKLDVKSLRDTRQLLEKVGLKEAESFIKDNPHPKLWLLLAEASLKNFESEGALEMAEAAFVRRSDYPGIRFVAHLNALHSNALKRAEILAYFKDFDEAEKNYLNEDRRDLAIALRKRVGHWFRVVELLKMSPNTTETQSKEAYSHIGDYYIDRQKWSNAIEYYTLANNTEGLKKCYMALEDTESLSKLNTSSPRKNRDNTVKVQTDIDIDVNQEPSIDSIILLKENGKMLQAAAVAFQLATIEASKKASPLRIKKLYILAGLLYSQNSVDGAKCREAVKCFRLAGAQHWLALAATRALARPARADAALRAAARLETVLSELHQAQLVQAWCTIALIAAESRTFNLCSRAFIKLEALEADNTFENLAIEVFTKHQPRDPKGNRVNCPTCHVSLPDWCSCCPACGVEWAGCTASARPLRDPHTLWRCMVCAHAALQHELVLRHSCPMCHTHVITST